MQTETCETCETCKTAFGGPSTLIVASACPHRSLATCSRCQPVGGGMDQVAEPFPANRLTGYHAQSPPGCRVVILFHAGRTFAQTMSSERSSDTTIASRSLRFATCIG